MDEKEFSSSLFSYSRSVTRCVNVGSIAIGGGAPLRVQSMTTTDTNDIDASVEQCLRIEQAGGELVRLTTQGEREARNIGLIKKELLLRQCDIPIVADVHFNPAAAMTAAALVDGVRINPGNYTGETKHFRTDADKISDVEWHDTIINRLRPLVEICKANNTAVRIGVNHGSLSDRIMARYGDTPQGMVASCVEYLDAFEELCFQDIVISIKSSNTRVMVQTVRLLAAVMRHRATFYPLHLGVTEAGCDDEGRIKSAAGIGALLTDGLGDTLRVSLTEAPEAEIPVAKTLIQAAERLKSVSEVRAVDTRHYSPYCYCRRKSIPALGIGGNNNPVVCVATDGNMPQEADWKVDIRHTTLETKDGRRLPMCDLSDLHCCDNGAALRLTLEELTPEVAAAIKNYQQELVIVGVSASANVTVELRALSLQLSNLDISAPFIASYSTDESELTRFQIEASAAMGLFFIDGLADGLLLHAPSIDAGAVAQTGDLLLQATRARFSHTEFISCPGCGRTLYDIQTTVRHIKERLGHLDGLKIGVMGCIVNGIGEMADADYGYVGARRGAISLYRGKELIERNIDEGKALDALVEIIRNDGKWKEPNR